MKTITTPAALRRDTRFQACSPGAKWVYGHLCDRAEVVTEAGLDLLGTVALIVDGLGDNPRAVLAPLLDELALRALVTKATDRLVIHAPLSARERVGPRGGMSGAARTARYRDNLAKKARAAAASDPSQPVTVTDDPSQSLACDGATRHNPPEVTDDLSHPLDVTDHPSHDPSHPLDVTDHPSHNPSPGSDVTDSPSHDPSQPATVTENPSHPLGVTENPSQPVTVTDDPSHDAGRDGSTRHNAPDVTENPSHPVTVTAVVTDAPHALVPCDGSRDGTCDGSCDGLAVTTVTAKAGPPPASLSPFSLPHTPSLSSSLPPPIPEQLPEARAREGQGSLPGFDGGVVRVAARAPTKPRVVTGTPPPSAPNLDAESEACREAYRLLTTDPAFGAIVQKPLDLARRMTDSKTWPAIDPTREARAAAAWLTANPANAKKNGDRFLINWFGRAQERAPRVTPPTSSGPSIVRSSPRFTRGLRTPVAPEFAPVDDPELYEIWKLEYEKYQKAVGR